MSEHDRSDALRQLGERARQDPRFLMQLISNPAAAAQDLSLSDDERSALGAADPDQLLGLIGQIRFSPACGDQQTCAGTCTVTYGLAAPAPSPPPEAPRPRTRRARS